MGISIIRPSELGPEEINLWHRMQRQTSSLANPFLCPEFAIAVDNCRPGVRLAVLADGPTIVGFFPFERRRFGVGVPIAAGLTDSQGLIHAPATDWEPRELLRACKLTEWQFDHLVGGQQPFQRYVSAATPSAVIDLGDGFATYSEKLRVKSPRFGTDVDRKARKLERESGELGFVVDSGDMSALRMLLRWKSDQYHRNGWVDVFARPWVVDLINCLFSIRSDWFSGLLSVLHHEGTPIAAHFGIRSGRTLAHWFPAYDVRFSKHSPGLIQHLRMAEECATLGINIIDMGTGAERYKQTLKSYDIFVAEGVVARGALSAYVHRVRSTQANWVRRHIKRHPMLFRAADRLLRHVGRVGLDIAYGNSAPLPPPRVSVRGRDLAEILAPPTRGSPPSPRAPVSRKNARPGRSRHNRLISKTPVRGGITAAAVSARRAELADGGCLTACRPCRG